MAGDDGPVRDRGSRETTDDESESAGWICGVPGWGAESGDEFALTPSMTICARTRAAGESGMRCVASNDMSGDMREGVTASLSRAVMSGAGG
jgi:hypothetical protein